MSGDRNATAVTPVVTLSALPLKSFSRGESYASADHRVADVMGLTRFGATYSEVPPGKSGCPYHVHHALDEMFVILEGRGRYRFGEATYEVRAGDVLGAPRGRTEFAHKLTNTGATPLKFLAISSMATTDVCEYPTAASWRRRRTLGRTAPASGSSVAPIPPAATGTTNRTAPTDGDWHSARPARVDDGTIGD